ncbi:MAG TPA: N-acetylneuraminate synthase family protein [Vicinamibacterales bacterium]|nr:N-acetylneuraminate synthase family protein [Vicinamibacterales bacterium]
MTIAGQAVGDGQPLFVVAELGLTHGGSRARALELVDAAATAGASAIKLQTLTASRLVLPSAPAPAHVTAASMQEFFGRFELSAADHGAIAARAHEHGLAFLSTPLDESAVDMLESAGCDAYKIASGDITHDRLIKRAAASRKPLLISTGMSAIDEIADAVAWARQAGAIDIVLLHCVSAYPVPAGAQNLRALTTLARLFGVPVGLSDHGTEPLDVALAVALGACVYEKHLRLDGQTDDVDEAVSLPATAFAAAVRTAQIAHVSLGHGDKDCQPAEAGNRDLSRRGLYAARALRAGERITADAVIALRPATALAPHRWQDLVGETTTRDIAAGQPFLPGDLSLARFHRGLRNAS